MQNSSSTCNISRIYFQSNKGASVKLSLPPHSKFKIASTARCHPIKPLRMILFCFLYSALEELRWRGLNGMQTMPPNCKSNGNMPFILIIDWTRECMKLSHMYEMRETFPGYFSFTFLTLIWLKTYSCDVVLSNFPQQYQKYMYVGNVCFSCARRNLTWPDILEITAMLFLLQYIVSFLPLLLPLSFFLIKSYKKEENIKEYNRLNIFKVTNSWRGRQLLFLPIHSSCKEKIIHMSLRSTKHSLVVARWPPKEQLEQDHHRKECSGQSLHRVLQPQKQLFWWWEDASREVAFLICSSGWRSELGMLWRERVAQIFPTFGVVLGH